MNQLQKALQLNALFSGLSGILLVAAHNRVAGLFDTPNSSVFQVIGVALIYFSLTIVFEIKHQNLLRVLFIIVQDSLWVIGSVILLIFQPFDISMTGNGVMAAIAIIVLFIAISQTNALAQTDNFGNKGIKQLSFERTMKGTKASVWKVISDVANYHEVAPNVDDVKIISGEGIGMVRSCSHGKDSWTETCSIWEEEKTNPEARERETELQNQMAQEARDRIEELRLAHREARRARGEDDDDNFNEDDYDVEVIYVNH